MPAKKMKQALTASLQAEDEAFQSRFQRAEVALPSASPTHEIAPPIPAPIPEPPPLPTQTRTIRDTFTFPQEDYELIATLQKRCLLNATNVNKSELLRAGLHALAQLAVDDLLAQVNALTKLKAGRPKCK